ncbi:hypothetical protein HJFPF1_02556 [Paramyrothecium foliicola]|nr:hypothetical protein HJFPF1_02556 [Paramyrothecium foliicola]
MSNSPSGRQHDDLMETILESLLGPATSGIRGQIRNNALSRGNTPTRWQDNFARRGQVLSPGTLWIVDRTLEPQTLAHFMSFMARGTLPGGAQTELPLVGMDVQLLTQPLAQWAPAPYNRSGRPVAQDLMTRIGSMEDGSRLQCISKNLQAMKSRIWEGVMPLSHRRWQDKQLDEPENFIEACQLITDVLTVFHYLNDPEVKANLRETYNLIWDHLKVFEDALNAKRRLESEDPVSPTSLWAEYIRSHYALMEMRTHAWLTERLDKLKDRVLTNLAQHQPSDQMGGAYDERQWELTNMWQDIIENASHADFALFMPMDGYKGCSSESATGRPVAGMRQYSGTTPLLFSSDIEKRRKDYHLRRRQVGLLNDINNARLNPSLARQPYNSPTSLATTCRKQAADQNQTRLELRGPTSALGPESFVNEAEHLPWGFVAYRAHYGHTDAEWAEFKDKFGADESNWGKELVGVDSIRARSTIHWFDARELGLSDYSVEALKRHFAEYTDSDEFPQKLVTDVFLVADEASIDSYLKPLPTPPAGFLSPGDFGGFILAVDHGFDASEPQQREDESPGYQGTLRVLGSLLWDDLNAMLVMQTQHLEDLWPLAMYHPHSVYVGPVVKAQLTAWRKMVRVEESFLSFYMKWQEEH